MLEIVAASVLGLISKVKAHESCCSGDAGDAQQQEEEPWLSTLDIVVLGAAGKKISIFFRPCQYVHANFYFFFFLTRNLM